jgi:hypothetical protein
MLVVLESKILRTIDVPAGLNVTRRQRKLHNWKLRDVFN